MLQCKNIIKDYVSGDESNGVQGATSSIKKQVV